MQEIDQIVMTEINRIAQKQAAHTVPKIHLSDILALRSVTKLKELARAYHIKGYSKMNFSQLILAVEQALVEQGRLEELLYILESPEWEAFKQTASVEQLHCDGTLCVHLDLLQNLGYVQTYFHEGQLCAVVPIEIKAIFHSLAKEGFPERKERSDLLHTYATAAINLYGVISQDEFVSIFNSHNTPHTDIDEIFQTLMKHIMVQSNYCFWDEYIVSDSFEDEDFEGAEALLHQVEGKPRYTPPKQEFIKYFDAEYYEKNEHTCALAKYLNTLTTDIDEAQAITDDICFECSMEASLSVIFDLLGENGITFDTMKQAEQFTNLLMNVKNNSRIWANKGHTPNEMFKEYHGRAVIPFPNPIKSEKIGRNELCPCGSGKKYKKCCGK